MPNLRARREVKSEARPGGMRALEQESSSGWDLRILTARKTQHQTSHHHFPMHHPFDSSVQQSRASAGQSRKG